MYVSMSFHLDFDFFLKKFSGKAARRAALHQDGDLTCDYDLGIIGLHVPIINSCPLSLPLLLGFLCIKRISIVLQNNQLWEEMSHQKIKNWASDIYLETTEQWECVWVCVWLHVCVHDWKIQRGQRIVSVCLNWHKAVSLHCILLTAMETEYMN